MSAAAFFDEMDAAQARHDVSGYDRTAAGRAAWRRGGRRLVHFAAVGSGALSRELEPRSLLFSNAEDEKKSMQYVWLSTPGVRTHTHFDSDHNIFVQLVGRKRFTLWAPNQTEALCMFPRLHPLWHKSRLDFERPDARPPCTDYGSSEALSVEVDPGDVLYLPPFWWQTLSNPNPNPNPKPKLNPNPKPEPKPNPTLTLTRWHTVETLSPSASLSTLSRYHLLYNRMRGLYRMNYHFDKLAHYEAASLCIPGARLLAACLPAHPHPAHAAAAALDGACRGRLLQTARRTVPRVGAPLPARRRRCGGAVRAGRAGHALMQQLPQQHQVSRATLHIIALSRSIHPSISIDPPIHLPSIHLRVYLQTQADAVIAWDEHFKHLPDGVREPLFDDYVEEITTWVPLVV
eukprot:scaffold99957_cov66-Phaeocystis_antarctica.AAC.2